MHIGSRYRAVPARRSTVTDSEATLMSAHQARTIRTAQRGGMCCMRCLVRMP